MNRSKINMEHGWRRLIAKVIQDYASYNRKSIWRRIAGGFVSMKINILEGCLFVALLVPFPGYSQTPGDQKAFDLLNKAMGPVDPESGSMAIYFEGIAIGASRPQDIFSLPAYKVYRGGFFFSEDRKFEMQIGVLKGLCDGKVMVIIDEVSKTMVIDSLRDKVLRGVEEVPDVGKLFDETFKDMQLKYSGKETVNGKVCHKIKGEFPDDPSRHVWYYIEEASGRLLLIGEWQGEGYDVYWIKKIDKAPKDHSYQVKLPNKELTSYYGYEVVDMRFAMNNLQENR